MKVLVISNYPAPYRVDLYNLISQQVDLTVAYGVKNDKTRNKDYKNENMKYKVIWVNGIRVGTRSSISFGIKKIIKNGNFDVIIVGEYRSPMSMIAMRYMKKHKIPFIFNADGGFVKGNESCFKKKVKTYFLSMPTAWMTSGKASDKYLCYYGADKDKIYHYPFAFNFANERYLPSREEKIKLKKEMGIKEKRNILFIGRMVDWKRVDKLLQAYSHLKGDFGLYFLGITELPKEYQEIVDKNNIKNIHCEGFKSGIELAKYYRASDVFVLPSKEEVWGLVINEAMTNSCPVITTDTCNAGLELIKNGENGILIQTDNVLDLINSMQQVLDDDELREKFAKNSYESMKDFNVENNAKQHLFIIKDFYNKYVKKE